MADYALLIKPSAQKELDALEHLIIDGGILERDITQIDLRSPTHYFFLLKNGEKKDAARDSVAVSGKNKNGAKDWADTRSPTEGESETQGKSEAQTGKKGVEPRAGAG